MKGGRVMESIKVLWMNNGDDSLSHFIDDAKDYDIDIDVCRSMKECYGKLNANIDKWNAIIVNADCRLDFEKPKISNLPTAIKELRKKCGDIPRFVALDKEKPNFNDKTRLEVLDSGENEEYYLLQPSAASLFEAIKNKVFNNPEAVVKRKYAILCGFCSSPHLVPLLQVLEGNRQIMPATAVPNECRKLLEWTQKNSLFTGRKLPVSIKDHLNWPVRKDNGKTCETYDELTLNNFSKAINRTTYIPEYVKRSFHHCCEITQDGSHHNEIDDLLSREKVPYVNKSLIYNLLNILHWCAMQN